MIHTSSIFGSLFQHLAIMNWRDVIEIALISSVFYYIALWLKKDRQKKLLPYFYGYCLLAFVAHFMQLATISSLIFLSTPLLLIFFALIHQDALQKNFIALKSITPARRTNTDWVEQLIRTSLIAINNGKEILCLIEREDSLANLIETNCHLNADCEQSVLEMLIDSQSFDKKKMIWLNSHGKLRAVNASWNTPLDVTWFAESVRELEQWKQAALFFTTKTDALMFHIAPLRNTFTIVVRGKLYEDIDTAQTLKFLNKYMMTSESPSEGVEFNESNHKKRTAKQPHA